MLALSSSTKRYLSLSALASVGTAAMLSVSNAFAAVYTLSGTQVTDIGSGASDTANSLFGIFADLFPVLIPVIVVGVALGLVSGWLGRRG